MIEATVRTIVRLNAEDVKKEFISTDNEMNEVRLGKQVGEGELDHDDPDSWVVDNVLDGIDEHSAPCFSSQSDTFHSFQSWVEENMAVGVSRLTCLLVGGRNSGKSFSMIGNNTSQNQGLVPRFVKSIFSPPNSRCVANISMYMAHDGHFADLLTPPHTIPYSRNTTHSCTMGVGLIPLQTIACYSADDALRILHLGLLATSVLAINTDDMFNTGNLVVSLCVQYPTENIAYSVDFVEASSLLFLPTYLSARDRLAGSSPGMSTANAFSECGLFGDINVSSSSSNAKNNRKQSKQSGSVGCAAAYTQSFLSYLLQETLTPELGTPDSPPNADGSATVLPPRAKCSMFLVACLRGCEGSLSEDRSTMEFVHVLSEKFQSAATNAETIRNKLIPEESEEVKHNDSDSVSVLSSLPHLQKPAVGGSVEASREPVGAARGNSITEMKHGLDMEIDILEGYLHCLPSCSTGSIEGSGGSHTGSGNGSSTIKVDKSMADTRDFLERKLFMLKRQKLFFDTPNSEILTRHAYAHTVPIYIQKWLKNRGVLGILVDDPPDSDRDPMGTHQESSSRDQQKKDKKNKTNAEKTSGVHVPWPSHPVPIDDPYLTPLSSLDFPRLYLHLVIPGGHMAVCGTPLQEDIAVAHVGDEAVGQSAPPKQNAFGGIKHCKIFRLNGKSVMENHCVFLRLSTSVKLRPLFDEDGRVALVQVNGRNITEETVLHHNDTIRIGTHCMFVLTIPNEPPAVDLGPRPNSGLVSSLLGIDDVTRNNYDDDNADSGYVNTFKALENLTQVITTPVDCLSSARWEFCSVVAVQFDFLFALTSLQTSLRHQMHMDVDRSLIAITKKKDLSDMMKMEAYEPYLEDLSGLCMAMLPAHKTAICEALLGISDINYWSKELRRHVRYVLHLEPVPAVDDSASGGVGLAHIPREYRGLEYGVVIGDRRYMVNIRAEMLEDGDTTGRGDSWVWAYTVFLRRYFSMKSMYTHFIESCNRDLELLDELYPASTDPFLDPSQPELIGVATLHLDSIFYLCDVKDYMPLVTFKGTKGGFLKMTVRTWIDEVETIPSYICVDKESKLSDFPGRKCIIRFYFEALNDINPILSSDVQIVFSFFHHSGQYRTTRHPARNTEDGDKHPYINSTLVIEQKITPDFIRYIQKKCIELEVWGSRISNGVFQDGDRLQQQEQRPQVGESNVMEQVRLFIISSHSKQSSNQATTQPESADIDINDERTIAGSRDMMTDDSDVDSLKNRLKEMAILLARAEKNLKRTARTSVVFRDEVTKTNAKISQTAKQAEAQLQAKNFEIDQLKRRIDELEGKQKQKEQELEAAKLEAEHIRNKNSKVCVVS